MSRTSSTSSTSVPASPEIVMNGEPLPQPLVEPPRVFAIKVTTPNFDRKIEKTFEFALDDTVWAAKQLVLLEFAHMDIKDPLNFGFYMPPYAGRAGKFLDEERCMREYPMERSEPFLEFRYKRRIFRHLQVQDEKKLQKVNAKSKRRKFMDFILANNVQGLEKLLGKGLDPNFQDDRTGETPFMLASTQTNCMDLMKLLVFHGAHLDFRAKDGSTAVHKATVTGRVDSLKCLLDLGSSPNYKDAKGLTPLYWCVLAGSNAYICELLLTEHAHIGVCDLQGAQEIHQACKLGFAQHLEHLIYFGADVNARTGSGNTPLHICALENQESCARVLLFRGADRTLTNFALQTAYDVAVVANNIEVGALIKDFDQAQVRVITEVAARKGRRRELYNNRQVSLPAGSEPSPNVALMRAASSPDGELVAALKKRKESVKNSLSDHDGHDDDFSGSETSSDSEDEPKKYKRTFSNAGVGTKRSPAPLKINPSGTVVVRNRLYASTPGRLFIAVADYVPQHAGELALVKGDSVEVLYVGEKGFFEGTARGKAGWFPSYCVQEIKKSAKAGPRSWFGKKNAPTEAIAQAAPRDAPLARTVTLRRGDKGFGFNLRGANSHLPHIDFSPTPQFPALQYIGGVDKDGVADCAGLRAGDFVLEINGENVVNATHGYAVALIGKTGGRSLDLKVITVAPETLNKGFLLSNGTIRSKDVSDVTDASRRESVPVSAPVSAPEVVNQRPPVEVTPVASKKTQPPPPPARSSSTVLSSLQASDQDDVVGELQGGIAAEPETVMLEKRDDRGHSTKSMWSDNACKLRGNDVQIREENIARGMGRKQKALSFDLASEFERKFQEITKQVVVNASDYPGASMSLPPPVASTILEESATVVAAGGSNKLDAVDQRMSHSSSGSSSSLASAGSGSPGARRPLTTGPQRQTPPPYEYSIESLRRRRLSEENQVAPAPETRSIPIDANMRPRSMVFPVRPTMMYDPEVRADFSRRSPRMPRRLPPPGPMQPQMHYNHRPMLGHNGAPVYPGHDQMFAAYNNRLSVDDQHFATMRSHNHPGLPMHPMQQFGGTLPSKHRMHVAHNLNQADMNRDQYRPPFLSDARISNGHQQYHPDEIAAGEFMHNQQNYRVMQDAPVLSSQSSKQPSPTFSQEKKPTPTPQTDGLILHSQGRLLPTDMPSQSSRSAVAAIVAGPPPQPEPDYDSEPNGHAAVAARIDPNIPSVSLKLVEPSIRIVASSMPPPPPPPPLPPLNNLESSKANAVAARSERRKLSQPESVSQVGKVTSPTLTSVNRRQQHPAVEVSHDIGENDSSGDGVFHRRDSATGSDCSNLYNSSSNASLDSQCSKDSGFDQSDGDHSSLLAQAVAKQRAKLAQRESVGSLGSAKELADVGKIEVPVIDVPVIDEARLLRPSEVIKQAASTLKGDNTTSEGFAINVARPRGDTTTTAVPPASLSLQIAPPPVKQKPKSGPARAGSGSSQAGLELARKLESDPNWPLTPTSEDAATIFLDDVIADAEASIDYDLISVGSRGSGSPAVKERLGSLTIRSGEERGKDHAELDPEATNVTNARPPSAAKENAPVVPSGSLPPPPEDLVEGLDVRQPQDAAQLTGNEKSSDPPPPYSPRKISVTTVRLPGQLSGKSFMEWSVEEVCTWLDCLQLGQYKSAFIENDIQGKHLPDLSKDEMKELGISKLGHRMTLEDEIGKMVKDISEI